MIIKIVFQNEDIIKIIFNCERCTSLNVYIDSLLYCNYQMHFFFVWKLARSQASINLISYLSNFESFGKLCIKSSSQSVFLIFYALAALLGLWPFLTIEWPTATGIYTRISSTLNCSCCMVIFLKDFEFVFIPLHAASLAGSTSCTRLYTVS